MDGVIAVQLIALQKDMAERFRFWGLGVLALNSELTPSEYHDAVNDVKLRRVDAVITTPEQLSKQDVRKAFDQCGVYAVIIDEATSAFHTEESPIIVATSAFGMDIDRGDVRLVVHFSLPLSIDEYWQKCGRAGRDGKKARATLIFSHVDHQINDNMIHSGGEYTQKQKRLDEMLSLA